MKLDVQSKGLLPTDLYVTGTFTAILDLAKYYNGTPSQPSEPSKPSNVLTTAQQKVFLFYRSYNKGQQSSEIKILQDFLQTQ